MNVKHKDSFEATNPPKCGHSRCTNLVEKVPGEWKWKKYCSKICGKLGGRERKIETFSKNFETTEALENLVEKRKQACIDKFGVDNPQKSLEVREKTKKTNLDRYGTPYAVSAPSIREKQKQTLLNHYGVDVPTKSSKILEKSRQTNLSKYGVEWSSQNAEVRNKQKTTCLERYGVENPLQNQQISQQIKQTLLERYGVDNPTKNAGILEEALNSGKRAKEVVLPSGKKIKLRGYEPQVLDELLKSYQETQIITDIKLMPKIKYFDCSKERRYFPDFFIPSKNLIVEVKSSYTFQANYRINLLKKESCLKMGYNFMFIIFDPKYNSYIYDEFTASVQDNANGLPAAE